MGNHGHVHGEAFMLMEYVCEVCQSVEWLWNSRDGVTPFLLQCVICTGTMKHENWEKDQYLPGYMPFPGDRYFVDLTKEKYLEFVDRMVAEGKFPVGNTPEEWWSQVQPGSPDVTTA